MAGGDLAVRNGPGNINQGVVGAVIAMGVAQFAPHVLPLGYSAGLKVANYFWESAQRYWNGSSNDSACNGDDSSSILPYIAINMYPTIGQAVMHGKEAIEQSVLRKHPYYAHAIKSITLALDRLTPFIELFGQNLLPQQADKDLSFFYFELTILAQTLAESNDVCIRQLTETYWWFDPRRCLSTPQQSFDRILNKGGVKSEHDLRNRRGLVAHFIPATPDQIQGYKDDISSLKERTARLIRNRNSGIPSTQNAAPLDAS